MDIFFEDEDEDIEEEEEENVLEEENVIEIDGLPPLKIPSKSHVPVTVSHVDCTCLHTQFWTVTLSYTYFCFTAADFFYVQLENEAHVLENLNTNLNEVYKCVKQKRLLNPAVGRYIQYTN